MNRYIDAEKLKAEIKKRIRLYKRINKRIHLKKDTSLISEAVVKGSLGAYESIERFIITLQLQQEQPEADLEKEVKSYIKDNFTITDEVAQIPEEYRRYSMWGDDMMAFASHFWKKGYNARKEERK